MSSFTIEIVADLTLSITSALFNDSFSPRFFTSLCSFQGALPGFLPFRSPSPSRGLGHWWAQVDSNHPCPQFAMVALFRCRSHRFLAHWPSASLLPPPAALGSGPALIRRAVGIPPVSFPSSLSGVGSLVGSSGLEPPTSRLSGVRSNQLSYEPELGGDERVRTAGLLRARQALSHLSYIPSVSALAHAALFFARNGRPAPCVAVPPCSPSDAARPPF